MRNKEKFQLAADLVNEICDNFNLMSEDDYLKYFFSEEFEELKIAVDRFKYLVSFSR